MSDSGLVIAYHGCDVTVRDRLVKGELKRLKHSNNRYDWLGPGSYFFEGDARRALSFAQAAHQKPEKFYTRQPVATPAAVGAILRVSRWLDMTTQLGMDNWRAAYESLRASQVAKAKPMPKNEPAGDDDETVLLRQLDCAVFTMLHEMRREDELPAFQAVRGAFYQGKPLADSSEFREHTHVQIALRDDACVAGWFLPLGNTLLTEEELEAADTALQEAVATGRARKRARA